MTSNILEIIQRNYDKFTGTNEAELHAAEEIAAIVGYWQTRCGLAEYCLAVSPCDPDITKKQIAAQKELDDFISNNPEPTSES